jgi:uncharacterized membrane-anchored protein
MRFTQKILFTLTALTAISAVSFAQSNSAQAIATVEIVQPITIARASDLNFGKIITGPGAMVVSPGGVRTQLPQPMHLSCITSACPFTNLIALAGHSLTHV